MSRRKEPSIPKSEGPRPPLGSFRYYDLLMAAFVAVLLGSNLISAAKQVQVAGLTFGAGVLFFPMSYLFGDVLTEVYGYARSRKVVWAGFGALTFSALMAGVVLALPPAAGWEFSTLTTSGEPVTIPRQAAWAVVFGGAWRIALASILGFCVGEFVNSYTLAKLKIQTRGRLLWTRTIGSTIVGEAADSLVFYPVAFLGIWDTRKVVAVMTANYLLKVAWEILATPLTYRVVAFLKRAEGIDYYDVGTDFSPFSLET